MATRPTLPHLSPTTSAERLPTAQRKRKRSFAMFNKKKQPSPVPALPNVSDESVGPSSLHSVAVREGPGPELRLLPEEASGAAESLPARVSHYVMLPRREDGKLHVPGEEGKHIVRYEWDYVMEHQRGFVFLTTPYFSRASLLPGDPPPYTTTGINPVACPLEEYQLPNPDWQWAGEGWCVDMRGDGEVQEDGFEYNWFFGRNKGWRPTIGLCGAGAWVRRRRWMRLRYLAPTAAAPTSQDRSPLTPNATPKPALPDHDEHDLGEWEKIRRKMRTAELDRERLETWQTWLDEAGPEDEKLLREHWQEAVDFFVYPRSRNAFRRVVMAKGWKDLPAAEGEGVFWSERDRTTSEPTE